VPVKSVTNHIGDKSIRWRQVGDRCQPIRRQSSTNDIFRPYISRMPTPLKIHRRK